jgi:hypothetical protein
MARLIFRLLDSSKFKLASTGALQVFFVAINTVFIQHSFELGIIICAFIISFIWSLNVKRVAFGDWNDRIAYATGAAVGCWLGFKISNSIII